MRFHSWDLGHLPRGAIVEITLSGNAANVHLLDSSNFSSYRAGRHYRTYGGNTRQSPVRLATPHSGHWHVAIDYGGLPGSGRASVRVLPGALPPLRQQSLPSLAQVATSDDLPGADGAAGLVEKQWDVFVSHATEDKEELVRPLAGALEAEGLVVWYDETALRIGDSLRRKIDEGLAKSRFGVVVLSHAFFKKNWPQYELDGLVTREQAGTQMILPLWHNISKSELIAISPSLADKVALSTANYTIEEIAKAIAERIQQP